MISFVKTRDRIFLERKGFKVNAGEDNKVSGFVSEELIFN
ncbi:hypothetical protein P872_21245 [Rhodonellum psychrophilum GCM71 = DSM 17998]|uniref:Uncharacterized protein n=1 Tax=Rhodonellum psychrophilum GCM71 = DSM 17998 TaxID=1123057 RepID=U5BT86_9BACT|nr:hypothetical protein P872_21245 [Rhodonellum psychrophilum GCM71 = DSM 17998]